MATRRTGRTAAGGRDIDGYEHTDKSRVNNPPVGLVTPKTDQDAPAKMYAYDPHLDPQLMWAGKAERMSFEAPTVSLHVHERIDPRTIIEAVRRGPEEGQGRQLSLFEQPTENPRLAQAIEFYKHRHGWSNRLIAGDSLLVMNSLLEKEGMAGQVQMVYIDPPYGIRYGSNFQPFVNRRDVKDGKDEDLTQEPETIQAFRDTWELGIHSYLTYLRDRLLLARELLHESGSVFVQIGDENVHLVRNLLDDVFGSQNFASQIVYLKTTGATPVMLAGTADYILWYCKNREQAKYLELYSRKNLGGEGASKYDQLQFADGSRRPMSHGEKAGVSPIPTGATPFRLGDLTSQSYGREKREGAASWFPVVIDGREFRPTYQRRWTTNEEGIDRLLRANRVAVTGNTLSYVRFIDDFPAYPLTNTWIDIGGIQSRSDPKIYVVQTGTTAVERCMLMTTDPGDLILDPTCGSGTTAYVSEQWGRRWITCDTSRVSLTLAKQRMMTAQFDYYELAHRDEGVGSGFRYRTVPHITLKSVAQNEPPKQETLYDQPFVDKGKARVTGPFTVEAVPAPVVLGIDEDPHPPAPSPAAAGEGETQSGVGWANGSVAREGETVRQAEWRQELLKTGIRGRGGQVIRFSRLEALPATRYLHADAETRAEEGGVAERAVISFGPANAPLEQRQVETAWEEARTLNPPPGMIVFAAFQFDPEAAKDIDELTREKTGMTFLKAQMNADLLTEDLKKKRASNESFWLVGQPDVEVRRTTESGRTGMWQVEVRGFDYYNTRTGEMDSGGINRIAMWMLDTDYDGRSLLPRQVFFPLAGEKDGWARLARNLKAEIDEDRIEACRGAVSLPFVAGRYGRAAVKIVDDRGIESLKIVELG
ncbi:MAG: site-specific DNA-methyltransferase [Chloroflexi bacterium]|nr:site-specific DNA-methyltransferase [Chloroflexota bacterium]